MTLRINLKTQTSDPHQVEINEERLVKITWTEDQLMENRACTDLFEVRLFQSYFGDWCFCYGELDLQ